MPMKLKQLLFATLVCVGTAISYGARDKIILLNEGNWQADNGKISYFEDDHVVSNQWFRDVNGYKLGDTPNDIIQVNDNLIAIAVNWSNIVQFIDAKGKAVGATEDIPNNRKLASDGRYVYVTSYGHECGTTAGTVEFTKGFVAKIDISSFKVVKAVEVGYEPEGIQFYDGHLFVANSGGYACQEDHEYEKTVSVIDAETMEVVRTVDTGQINLYGKMSISGQYLCINSPGDYYEIPAATIIFDCQAALDNKPDKDCFVKLAYSATYNCTAKNGNFYAVGSRYSYLTGGYEFNYVTIDPALCIIRHSDDGVGMDMPGTVIDDLKTLTMPYGIYVNPYTGYIYATDAGEYVTGGKLVQWNPDGVKIGEYGVYINPAHFLALNPDHMSSITDIETSNCDEGTTYNLQGIPVAKVKPGEIYIRNGVKYIQQQ